MKKKVSAFSPPQSSGNPAAEEAERARGEGEQQGNGASKSAELSTYGLTETEAAPTGLHGAAPDGPEPKGDVDTGPHPNPEAVSS